jgi:multidrug efflux pump
LAVNSVISNVGKNAGDPMNPDRSATPHKSKVTIAFVKKDERGGISSEELLNKVREKTMGIPGAEISVQRESNGPPTGKPIAIEIVGKEFDEMIQIEKEVRRKIEEAGIKGIEELKSDLVTNKPEIIVNVDREKASREGISSSQVALAIRTALFGAEISKFRDSEDEYPIQLRLKQEDRNQVEKLLNMNITYRDMNMGGVLRNVPLSSIADISYTSTFSQINRKDNERIITLSSDVILPYNATEVNQEIMNAIGDIKLPAGYVIRQGGEQEEQAESMAFLGGAFLVSLVLIYLILAAQFNSIIKPVIIFVTILLSLIGVLLGFMVFGKTFSVIMSGVGIIALAGIVVKNGILLIEFTDELIGRGYGLKEAIVEAGSTRLTPVLLTAASAVLGLIPLALGLTVDFGAMFVDLNPVIHTGGDSAVFWNILAWTIIYGLTFSTILTLLIVPCMYYINERVKVKLWKK